MNNETDNTSIAQTRGIWLVLCTAGLLWTCVSVWAYISVRSEPLPVAETAQTDIEENRLQAASAAQAEEERLQAEARAEEERLQAEAEARAEEERLQAEAEARAEEERLQAEAEAQAEEERLQAEAEARAEEERLRAEAEARAEEERLRAEAEAAAARVAAVKADALRLLEETRSWEQSSRQELDAELADVEAIAALTGQSQDETQPEATSRPGVDESAVAAAAAEAARVAAVARRLRDYERQRAQELGVLSLFSGQINFELGTATVTRELERPLDRMFEPLFIYSEVPISVSVATNESSDRAADDVLSRERAQSIIAYLVERGLDESRFRISVEEGNALPNGTHRVRVSPEDAFR